MALNFDSYCPVFSGDNKDRWISTICDSASSADEQSQFVMFSKGYDCGDL